MRCASMLLVLTVCCAAMPAAAQVNKWVDEKGRVQYGDKPPVGKGQVQKPPVNAPAPAKAPAGKPLAVQPKLHVPGDPLVARMHENEERKQREAVTAKCWTTGQEDCNEPDTIRQMMAQEKKASAAPPKPNPREPPPDDFCKRNPKVEACMAKK